MNVYISNVAVSGAKAAEAQEAPWIAGYIYICMYIHMHIHIYIYIDNDRYR